MCKGVRFWLQAVDAGQSLLQEESWEGDVSHAAQSVRKRLCKVSVALWMSFYGCVASCCSFLLSLSPVVVVSVISLLSMWHPHCPIKWFFNILLSVSVDYNTSTVRVVGDSEVDVWRIVTSQQQRPLNNTNILVYVPAFLPALPNQKPSAWNFFILLTWKNCCYKKKSLLTWKNCC